VSDSADPTRPLLVAAGVSVVRGAREIVHNVDLQLNVGEVVALLGPNGAGKSTLLECLSGGLTPSDGTIERAGRIAIALQPADLARRSVLTNVELALAWWGVPRSERRDRALSALASLRVEHLAQRSAARLSGGERRRVHLARALAVQPDILLLDEPFAGLDAESRGRLLEDSTSFLRSPERATLVVVHDRAEAWAIADRLLILIDGRIAASGAPREVLDSPPNAEVARFLGYDGELHQDGTLTLTRPAQVRIDSDGALTGRVTRTVPLEDGVRVELTVADGILYTVCDIPGPAIGDELSVSLTGTAKFPAETA
jgi:ABC-type sulfate/molybdate transport systems ATPase subunit